MTDDTTTPVVEETTTPAPEVPETEAPEVVAPLETEPEAEVVKEG